MMRTSYIRWDHVRFVLKQQSVGRNVTTLGHIILILNQPVIALSP